MRTTLCLISAVVLAACSRPSLERTGEFEAMDLSVIAAPACIFSHADSPDPEAALFVTYDDNADDLAVTAYKRETLKLAPTTTPDFSADRVTVTYKVVDYPSWEVALDLERNAELAAPATHAGTLTLVGTSVTSPIAGYCDS